MHLGGARRPAGTSAEATFDPIGTDRLALRDLLHLLDGSLTREVLVDELPAVVVVQFGEVLEVTARHLEALATLPAVIVGVSTAGIETPGAAVADVVVSGGAPLERVLHSVSQCPGAATALTLLLRGGHQRGVAEGLVAESSTYSMLQCGPEFEAWRASYPVRSRPPTRPEDAVSVHRHGTRLDVTLSRPEVHNAFNAAMRDGLVDALALAEADGEITEIHLRGEGPSFCSGGDLDEFGSRPDPVTAHMVRLARSPAWLMHALSSRLTCHLHGSCMGSGIELPAFAGRVVATPDASFALPETGLGLIPGAGGTVSLPRRIGRHRTAELAFGAAIDAGTALAWGLVDAVQA